MQMYQLGIKQTKVLLFFILLTATAINLQGQTSQQKVFNQIDSLTALFPKYETYAHDSGIMLANEALRLSNYHEYNNGRITALIALAVFNQKLGKKEYVSEYINSAYSLAVEIDDKKQIGNVLFAKGTLEVFNLDYDNAYKNYMQAAEISMSSGDTSRYAFAIHHLGSLCRKFGKYPEALSFYKKSHKLILKYNNEHKIFISAYNLGTGYESMNIYDTALIHFREALSYAKNNVSKAYVFTGISSTSLVLNQIDSAEIYSLRAIEIGEETGTSSEFVSAYNLLGTIYKAQGKNNKAIKYWENGYELIKNSNKYTSLESITLELSNIYREKKQYEKAFFYSDLAKAYSDSVNETQNIEQFNRLNTINEYKQKLNNEKVKSKHKATILVIAALLLLIIILITIKAYFRQRKKTIRYKSNKTQLESTIKQKDLDLLSKTMHLNEKEELIKSLEEKLKQLSRDMKPSKSKNIQSLISEIRVSKSDNIWEEFESRFNSVNDDFLQRLKNEFPELSPKELRLCSLLRLNLSTKEISAVTHQNPLSINKARFRLRKKLNLNNTETNLTSFIMEY